MTVFLYGLSSKNEWTSLITALGCFLIILGLGYRLGRGVFQYDLSSYLVLGALQSDRLSSKWGIHRLRYIIEKKYHNNPVFEHNFEIPHSRQLVFQKLIFI